MKQANGLLSSCTAPLGLAATSAWPGLPCLVPPQ